MIPRRVVRELERQLTREPGNLTVRVTLAAAYRELGRGTDAVEQYRLVAAAYLQEGRHDEAMSACTSALALAPDDRDLQAQQARAQAAQAAAPRRGAREAPTAAGRKAMRPVSAPGERAPGASGGMDLETPLPPPMPLHDTGDSLVGMPVGMTTQDVTAELPPLPALPTPRPLPPSPAPRTTLMGPAQAAAAVRGVGATGPLPRLSAPRAPQPRPGALPQPRQPERLPRPPERTLDAVGASAQGAAAVRGGDLAVESVDELDVGMPVVALTEVRRAGERPSSPDISSELQTRRRPKILPHELELLDLEILVAADPGVHGDAAPAAGPTAGAVHRPDEHGGARAARDTTMELPDTAIELSDTAIDTPELPAAPVAAEAPSDAPADAPGDTRGDAPVAAAAAPPAPIASAGPPAPLPLPPAPTDFDDEPTQPPTPGAAPPHRLHAAAEHHDGDGGTFAGGFTGTLAELAPDGSAVEGALGVFSMLPEEAASELARRAVVKLYDPGEVVVREGDAGDACYVIARGEVVVTRQAGGDEPPIELARLGEGALFGEFALLADRRRHATVTTLGEAEIYIIPRLLLRELAAIYPDVGPALERFYRERLLANLIHTSPLFARLAVDQRVGLLTAFEPMRVESGHALVRQGARAGGLFLIVLGSVEVVCKTDDRRAVVLATLGEGAYVGETSLLTGEVATASVVACGPVELAALPAAAFYRVVSEYPELWVAMRDEADARRLRAERILSGRTAVV